MNPKYVIIFLVSVAAVHAQNGLDELNKAAEEVGQSLKQAESKEVSGLQKLLAELLDKIRVRVQERHEGAQDLINKVHDVAGRLNELHARKGEKVQALVDRLSGRVKELVESLVDKLTGRARNQRSIVSELEKFTDEELLKQLDFDRLMLESFLRKQFDELTAGLNRQRRQADQRQNPVEFLREAYEKIFGHFANRYRDFAAWLDSVWKNGVEQARDQHTRLVNIAKEVINDAKNMQKETLRESLEVLKPYQGELGGLWKDLTEAVNKALKK